MTSSSAVEPICCRHASAGRVPGYGVITNIINGGLECGHGQDDRVASRIGFSEGILRFWE
ncbi:hypothetical protein GBA52_023159 [Prunus armeniaca]|nr:hypothetical protein GBA52_023159 [Prunus armeniaca]